MDKNFLKVDRYTYNYILPPPPPEAFSQNENDYGTQQNWLQSPERKAFNELNIILNESIRKKQLLISTIKRT